MSGEARHYLEELARRLRLDPQREWEILQELQSHLEERVHELEGRGLPREVALEQSLQELGRPDLLAREFYAVHSRASWSESWLAGAPHLLLALLFAFHLWTVSIWVVLLLISATVVTLLAWQRGQPVWLYPWLGYSLVTPVAFWFLTLWELAYAAWSAVTTGAVPLPLVAYGGFLLYVPLGLILVWRIWVRVLRRDWLYGSLTILPFPFLTSWILYLNKHGGPFAYDSRRLLEADGATALVFLGLALTTLVVYRVGQRMLRVAVLTLATPLLILLAALAYEGSVLSGTVFLLLLFGLGVLVLPALLDTRRGHPGRHRPA